MKEQYAPVVNVPEGTQVLEDFILDDNVRLFREREAAEHPECETPVRFSLSGWTHIGLLRLPASLGLSPSKDACSPFASQEMGAFMYAKNTAYHRIKIDKIENLSPQFKVD